MQEAPMLDELKKLWAQTPWYLKLFLLVVVPLLLLDGGVDQVRKLLANIKNANTDEKAKELAAKGEQLSHDAAQSEGRIKQLEEERKHAGEKAKSDDAVEYYNDLGKDKK
jgi:flagellar motility protein MotE (MotC chaperone)